VTYASPCGPVTSLPNKRHTQETAKLTRFIIGHLLRLPKPSQPDNIVSAKRPPSSGRRRALFSGWGSHVTHFVKRVALLSADNVGLPFKGPTTALAAYYVR
jgi:hypothetical protein